MRLQNSELHSKVWMRKFFALGKALLEAKGKTYSVIDPAMSGGDLYDCRRDAEGVPYSRAAQSKEPTPQGAQASFFHHLLVTAGRLARALGMSMKESEFA